MRKKKFGKVYIIDNKKLYRMLLIKSLRYFAGLVSDLFGDNFFNYF